eukprot:6173453-Pleurochrysis_carterae.AAC.4
MEQEGTFHPGCPMSKAQLRYVGSFALQPIGARGWERIYVLSGQDSVHSCESVQRGEIVSFDHTRAAVLNLQSGSQTFQASSRQESICAVFSYRATIVICPLPCPRSVCLATAVAWRGT